MISLALRVAGSADVLLCFHAVMVVRAALFAMDVGFCRVMGKRGGGHHLEGPKMCICMCSGFSQ